MLAIRFPWGKAHRWEPEQGAPHAALRGHEWMRSHCGLIERRDAIVAVNANEENRCQKCERHVKGAKP